MKPRRFVTTVSAMVRLLIPRLAALALATLAAMPALTVPARAEDAAALSRALSAAAARDWAAADAAARASGPVAVDLILWQRLRAGQGTWTEYRDFARRNGDWPGMELFWRRGDALVTANLPPVEVLDWFGARRPTLLTAELALLAALQATDPAAAAAEARRFWIETPLTEPDQQALLAARPELAAASAARVTRLLDQGEWAAAETALPLLPEGPDRALALARIAVQARRDGVDAMIRALPMPQRDDAGLALDRFRWRVAAKQHDGARALMLERSEARSDSALRDPAQWGAMRVDYARAALRAGDWALAERLAGRHFLPETDRNYPDLEWIAGYAALRAGATDRALAHFTHLESKVDGPISTARALYWQGRALAAKGDAAGAETVWRRAAGFGAAWYGQLAAERVGATMDPHLATLTGAESLPDWRGSALARRPMWQAAVWLIAAGDPGQGQRFLTHMAEAAGPEDIGRMARLMLELDRPWDALRLAKAAAGKGAIYPAAYFPLPDLARTPLGVPPELALAIARRESEFNPAARSPVGALGLMQVMPDTARMMARERGEPFDTDRLTRDPAYNARLGASYLAGLRARFGPSMALVAAGYNAGPGRSARWLRDAGDLRVDPRVDPVDWVEMIPFDETRIYVMRVAEALPIYRARLAGRPVPLVPSWDLRGGGQMPPPDRSPLLLVASEPPQGRPQPPAPQLTPAPGAPVLGFGATAPLDAGAAMREGEAGLAAPPAAVPPTDLDTAPALPADPPAMAGP